MHNGRLGKSVATSTFYLVCATNGLVDTGINADVIHKYIMMNSLSRMLLKYQMYNQRIQNIKGRNIFIFIQITRIGVRYVSDKPYATTQLKF